MQEGDRECAWPATLAIALLALLAWWPLAPYWQSDDFLAITYASDPHRALSDLTGNQYAAPAMVWFYRPLITLSFALDAWLGGADPFIAHLSNAIAHALSTLLLTRLGRRLLGHQSGLCLGLLWGLWPTHAGSISWAVGRVDSHTTVWILLSWFCTLCWLDRGDGSDHGSGHGSGHGRRAAALAAFALALLSKELAFIVPGGVALLALATAPAGARLRQAWRATWPFLVLFAVYLAWRYAVLGRLVGGYQDAHFSLSTSFAGLGTWSARLANPLLALDGVGDSVRVLGFVVWPVACIFALCRRRWRSLLLLGLGFGLCALPTAPFWAGTDELRSVRYFYLPATCLLGIVALGGRWPTLLALAGAAWPLLMVRQHYFAAHGHAAALHATLQHADHTLAQGPLFVRGLPRENAHHDVLMFHLFVDRLLLPPFGSGRRLYALRPLVERPGVLTLPDTAITGIDAVHAFAISQSSVPELTPLPAPALLPLHVEPEGDLHLSALAMWDLHLGRSVQALRVRGDRSPYYRLTLFTGGGYIASVLANESPDQPDGRVSLKTLIAQGRYATAGDDAVVAIALNVPTAFDVTTEFPLLVEAGDLQGADPPSFVARARATRLFSLRFDRDYCEWLAGRIDDPRKAR